MSSRKELRGQLAIDESESFGNQAERGPYALQDLTLDSIQSGALLQDDPYRVSHRPTPHTCVVLIRIAIVH